MRSLVKGSGGARLWAGALAFGLSLAFSGAAHAAPQYAMDCTSCHTMPPADSGTPKKNPFTGAVPGNHQGHASDQVASCVVCHGSGVTAYATSHRNKTIEFNGALGYQRPGSAFLNQTSVPPAPLGTCSAASCHSDGKGSLVSTPAWGRTPFQFPGDCSQCHLVAPNNGNHPVTGSKHGNYFGTGTDSCQKCHANHTTFSHATSAGKRNIDVHFASGGSFDVQSRGCSNVYCHSNGKGAYTPVTWGSSLDCSGCHGTATGGATALSGKHAKHVNNAAFLGANYGCVECHSATVSDNNTIANRVNHTTGSIDVVGTHAGTLNAGSCATSYCHSDGKSTQKPVTWSQSQSLDCSGCHGSDSAPDFTPSFGAPNYANLGAGNAKANSHKVHVNSAADCQNCHAGTTVDGLAIKTGSVLHTNGTAEVAAGNGKTFTPVGKTCSNISCHGGNGLFTPNVANPQWGASLGCTGCHGDASTLSSYAHAKHVSTTTGKGYSCDTCHAVTVSGSSTIINQVLHGNGTAHVANFFNSSNNTCATSCHNASTPNWTVASTGGCGSCHAALSGTGVIATKGHAAHFGANYGPKLDGSTANSCASCHSYTGDTAATHDNGQVELAPGYSKSGTCNGCHKQAVNWDTAGRISCESCHTGGVNNLSVINGKTASDKSEATLSGHGSLANAQQCVDCHDSSAAHIGVPGGTSRLYGNTSGTAACTGCHDGSTAPARQNHVGFANSCQACHDPHGTGYAKMVLKNISSVSVNFTGTNFVNAQGTGVCQACHTNTAYFKRNVAETSHPATGCLDCHAHTTSSGTAFEPNRSCDSCHGYPPAPRRTTAAVTFGVQGNWSSARFEDYSGGGGAHLVAAHIAQGAKPSDGWVNCTPCHKDGAASHNKAMPMRDHVEHVTVKLDPQFRFSDDAFMAYTGAQLVSGGVNKTGSCFNVSCHFKQTRPWSIER